MSTVRWIIIAGLLGMLVGAVCCENLHNHKKANSIPLRSTLPFPVEVVSVAGYTVYEKCCTDFQNGGPIFEERGWHPGRFGKYILPPLLMGAVFIGFVGIILIIRWVNALPNLNVNELTTPQL